MKHRKSNQSVSLLYRVKTKKSSLFLVECIGNAPIRLGSCKDPPGTSPAPQFGAPCRTCADFYRLQGDCIATYAYGAYLARLERLELPWILLAFSRLEGGRHTDANSGFLSAKRRTSGRLLADRNGARDGSRTRITLIESQVS